MGGSQASAQAHKRASAGATEGSKDRVPCRARPLILIVHCPSGAGCTAVSRQANFTGCSEVDAEMHTGVRVTVPAFVRGAVREGTPVKVRPDSNAKAKCHGPQVPRCISDREDREGRQSLFDEGAEALQACRTDDTTTVSPFITGVRSNRSKSRHASHAAILPEYQSTRRIGDKRTLTLQLLLEPRAKGHQSIGSEGSVGRWNVSRAEELEACFLCAIYLGPWGCRG